MDASALHRNSPSSTFEEDHILPALERRRKEGSLRKLQFSHQVGAIDFSSNDYLGLAQSRQQFQLVEKTFQKQPQHVPRLGSTGSRLLTGDSDYTRSLEDKLAKYHNSPAALLANSGYDANLAVLSTLTMNNLVLMDELCHNSQQMGIRLSRDCDVKQFQHNNVEDLERLLKEASPGRHCIIVVETVYSMDGDRAPVVELFDMALRYNACVIVDEAHALGVFGENGMGVLSEFGLENHPSLLCSVHTFGKAAGCHGAVICSSQNVKEYLLNYARPIIYSTAVGLHALVTIECSYETMRNHIGKRLRRQVYRAVQLFRRLLLEQSAKSGRQIQLISSISPIQALVVPGNQNCLDFCQRVAYKTEGNIKLFPIRSPTVPKGQERVRVIIHAHNTDQEIQQLVELMVSTLMGMTPADGLLTSGKSNFSARHDVMRSKL
ncbi:unnamed protein product [Cylindrotheca closterium]|uniref:Aminotransferase class I/classII large domain-containing protein n=1 Tax=Cylindrotheca closterium TaxID=2856 RepID=A0AAD2PWZ5_9STRA|nr:unnamed protein product [Cylindrotheca closterium]